MKTFAIIGGGASGCAAALMLKRLHPECTVTVLEKNDRILKKLLTTGNGKCNITNLTATPEQYDSCFADEVLQQHDFESVKTFLCTNGIFIKQDAAGRCYPLSESAANVVNLLLRALKNAGVIIKTDFDVHAVKPSNRQWLVCGSEEFLADAVILAVGSAASVKGYNGLDLLANLGMRIVRPTPALCPIPSDEPFMAELKGVRVKGSVRLDERKESGEIQFAEHAVSGICAFNLSRFVLNGDTLRLDFNSEGWTAEQLHSAIETAAKECEQNASLLDFLLPKKLALVLLKQAALKPSGSPKEISNEAIKALVNLICEFPVRVSQPTEYKNAQTVCGGLNETSVNPLSLSSRKHKGLYFCGEILDVDAPCGGFNLHWAWASGMYAAEQVVKYLEK